MIKSFSLKVNLLKKELKKIHSFFITSIFLLALNSSYICENSKLNLVIRNNINGDFSIVEKISELKPGAFININWNKKKLMLPFSLRKYYISFTDKKWDWRYQFNKDGSPNINNPSLYELLPSGKVKAHHCQSEDKSSNL